MLKSRRGLLAAGLAVAVVGALGVASTLNAGAEQIPGTQDTTSASASADPTPEASASADATEIAADVKPAPKLLPWGALPQPISKGSAGANSSALRAAGVDAADADTSGDEVPDAKFAPKGRTAKTSFLKSETVDAPPPQPADSSDPAAPTPPPTPSGTPKANFFYNTGSQAAATDGFYANLTISRPKLVRGDFHSLAELALQSADTTQIVEVGWNVDRVVNGDDDPHLFVYHWVNNKTSCYNGCGWVQSSTNIKPGDTLAYDVTKKFGIKYIDGDWWIAFDTEWVGYFPETLWNDEHVTFNKSGYLQVFGEIAAAGTTSCTQMGNGIVPNPTNDNAAARASSVSFVNGPAVNLFMRSSVPDQYAVAPYENSVRSFQYGGPLANPCPAPTATPTPSASN